MPASKRRGKGGNVSPAVPSAAQVDEELAPAFRPLYMGQPVPTRAETTLAQLVERARDLGAHVPDSVQELAAQDEALRLASRKRAPGAGRPVTLTQYDRHDARIEALRQAIATVEHREALPALSVAGNAERTRLAAENRAAIDELARDLLAQGVKAADLRRAVLLDKRCRWSASVVRRNLITLGHWTPKR